jgi:hypothetical protein
MAETDGTRGRGMMIVRKHVGTFAAVALALAVAGCDDGAATDVDEASAVGSTDEAGDESDEGDEAEEAEAAEGGGSQPADLPEQWPEELPLHDGVELGRVIVDERDDGTVLVTLQYSTDESTDESAAYLESLADEGWDVEVEEGSEGTSTFVDGNLEGHGWDVSVSFQNQLYTWSAREL